MFNINSTADEIENAKIDTVILPIGSTEQHGSHLPIGTDCIIGEYIAQKLGEKLNVFVAPMLPISTCRENMGKKGGIWMNPDTFYHMLCDIVFCLKEQGFRNIIVLLSHGGIFTATPAIRQINASDSEIRVIKIDLVNFFVCNEVLSVVDSKQNLHSGEIETSIMMYINENLVRKNNIKDCVPDVPRDYLNYASFLTLSENGVWGCPSLATKEKGKKLIEIMVQKSFEYYNDVIKKCGFLYSNPIKK